MYEQVKMIRQKPEMVACAASCALKRLITVHTLSVSGVGDRTKITFRDRVPDASSTDVNAGLSFYICYDKSFV